MTGIRTVDNDEWKCRERKAYHRARDLANVSDVLGEVGNDYIVVRGLLPARDLDSGADNNWTDETGGSPQHKWLQDWSSGGASASAYNEAYTIDPDSLSDDKIIVIYGLTINSTNADASQIRFKGGKTGSGGIVQEANLEMLENDDESRGVFPEDLVYKEHHFGQIEMWLDATNDGKRVVLNGWVAEAPGENITSPTEPKFL